MSTEKKIERIQISVPSFGEEEFEAIKLPLQTGWVTQGKYVREFEKSFAEIHGVQYALATSSCTTALHLMLIAAGIGSGDEVLVPSFTWIATANAVIYSGATPVLVDIDLETFNISVEDTLKKITEKTKAIIVVHLFGLCVNVTALRKIVDSKILIFEDAACAAGAGVGGLKAGNIGDAAAFSFHPRKTITTGEGGMLTTNNLELARTAEKLRNHGAEISEEARHLGAAPYLLPDFKVLGYNYRMTDLQGAIGKEQIKKLDLFIRERAKMAKIYEENLSEISWLKLPIEPHGYVHAWQAYVMRVIHEDAKNQRNRIMSILAESGIDSRPGTHAIHNLELYRRKFNFKPEDFPNSLSASETSLAIPLHNKLTLDDQMKVIEALRKTEF